MTDYLVPGYHPFNLFSTVHLIVLLLIVIFNLFLLVYLKKKYSPQLDKYFRYFIGVLLVITELSLVIWYIVTGTWDWGTSLPLHLCRLAAFFTGAVLILDSKTLAPFTYFVALGPAIPALLTPQLPYTFPHFLFFKFFVGHGAMITGVLYLILIKGYRPYFEHLWKTVVGLNLMLPFIGLINWLTGGNYFFLAQPPAEETAIAYLGSWPWYIFNMQLIGVIFLGLLYLPYYFSRD